MSGQPVNTPLDIKKYRQQYLANLQQEIANNTKNYEANIVFKKTGVPQQLTDTRSLEEKVLDVFRLKLDLRSGLKEITDDINAVQVVEGLNDNELRFASSALPYIIADLKPKYKYGIPSSPLLGYIRAYIAKQERNMGIENGVQAEVGDRILLNQQLIMDNVIDKNDLAGILSDLRDLKASKQIINALVRTIREVQDIMPDIQEVLRRLNQIDNANVKDEINQLLTASLRELPTKDQVEALMMRLDDMNQAKDRAGIESILLKLNEIFQIKGDVSEELEIIKELIEEKAGQLSIQIERGTGRYIPLDELEQLNGREMVNYIFQITKVSPQGKEFKFKINQGLGKDYTKATVGELYGILVTLDDQVRAIFANRPVSFMPSAQAEKAQPTEIIMAKAETPSSGKKSKKQTELPAGQKKMTESGFKVIEPEKQVGKGIKGKGVGRPRTRNYEGSTRPHRADILTDEDIDFTAGIKVEPRFIPFGKYVLNKRLLGNNIISLKTKNGGYIKDFKTEKVGSSLGGVLKTIVGNGMPSFDELASLTDSEKDYLHRIAKKSDIIDRLNIPAPSKKQDDKDINQFEIMKGQILAGNDNIDLIHKFKAKLLSLSNRGVLPKGQVKDILFELTSMGF